MAAEPRAKEFHVMEFVHHDEAAAFVAAPGSEAVLPAPVVKDAPPLLAAVVAAVAAAPTIGWVAVPATAAVAAARFSDWRPVLDSAACAAPGS